jgi:hypothetical protein
MAQITIYEQILNNIWTIKVIWQFVIHVAEVEFLWLPLQKL